MKPTSLNQPSPCRKKCRSFWRATQERQIEMTQLYLFEALERVNAKAKEAIVSFAEGAQQAGMIAGVKQYTKYAEYPMSQS